MSKNIWVISDTHFNHTNIIGYCDRPFINSKEMDEKMVENWNSVVKDGDIVYHLGDVYFGVEGRDSLSKLKGRKRLILGNHDNGKDTFLHKTFQKIMVWRMFPEFGLLLSHIPLHKQSLERWESSIADNSGRSTTEVSYYLRNIHGHIHNRESPSKYHRNVSVEQINYTPINIEELRTK